VALNPLSLSYSRANPQRIVVLGGSGFVGRSLIARLARAGHTLIIPTRHPAQHRDLLVNPGLSVRHADIHDTNTLSDLVKDADTVVNLVGILFESKRQTFQANHTDLVLNLLHAMRTHGTKRLIAMSSLGARSDGPSEYLRSKGRAEAAIRASELNWSIIRPSVIFGPGDNFLNQFAHLLRWAPILPLARTHARFSPCYVEDVSEALARCIQHPQTHHRAFDLGGPEIFTLKELVLMVAHLKGWHRSVLTLPDAVGLLQAWALECLPTPPMTRDNFASLSEDSVTSDQGFTDLGILPARLTDVVPRYLHNDSTAARHTITTN